MCAASLGMLGFHAFAAAQHQALLGRLPAFPLSGAPGPEPPSSPPILTPVVEGKERRAHSKASIKNEHEVVTCSFLHAVVCGKPSLIF